MPRSRRRPLRSPATKTASPGSPSRRPRPKPPAGGVAPDWTFLSNHGHVLICLAQKPDAVLREVALRVGITERSVQNIVADLVDARVLVRTRDGRRNRYRVNSQHHLRHPVESHCTIAALIDMVLRDLPLR